MFISPSAEPKLHGNYSHFVSYGARLFAENPFVEYDCTSKTTHCGTQANNADPDQGLHCLLTGCYIKFEKMMSQSTKMFSTNSNGRKLILSVVKYNPQRNSLTTLASNQKDIYSSFVIRL